MNPLHPSKPSTTYKLKMADKAAMYFTISDLDEDRVWMFLNSKEMDSFQWITALMSSYSKLISKGVEVTEIISMMKETFDPNGNYIIQDGTSRMVNGVVHHLGLVLEKHCGRES